MKNFFWHEVSAEYPKNNIFFNPGERYPEYPFGNEISDSPNQVYEMIRNLFISLRLDEKNAGKTMWNPLSEYINQGDTVLIKPNLVNHQNGRDRSKQGLECLVTHPSVIRCIVDYVIIALRGTGTIIIADAPVQGCDFEKLKKQFGYKRIEEFYKNKGIILSINDLRDSRGIRMQNHLINKKLYPKYKGVVVDLGKKSYFYDINSKRNNYRITNYDYNRLNKNHYKEIHRYCISEACLQADVIINLPKPKSHRKAGYTGALKNMIGVNTSKEFLPHHMKGSKSSGGDEYFKSNICSYILGRINDTKDVLNRRGVYFCDNLIDMICRQLFDQHLDNFSEGSWWGNDTIWKTILDVNTIINYADKNGKMTGKLQRKIISIGDMIYCGEREGPLLPTPKRVSGILFADNAVLFDLILVRIMGFDKEKIPVLVNAVKDKRIFKDYEVLVNSNDKLFCKKLDEVLYNFSFHPSSGWKGMIELT